MTVRPEPANSVIVSPPNVRLVILAFVKNALVEVMFDAVSTVGLKLVVAKFVKNPFVEVTLCPSALVNPRLVTNKFVEVALPNTLDVAKKLVELALVNTPVEAIVAPIGVLLMVPPSIVRPFTTNASVSELLGKFRVEVTVKIPIVVDGEIREPVMVSPVMLTNRVSKAEPSR